MKYKRVLKKGGIVPELMHIPNGIKANCYAFALAPNIGIGGYANRPQKSRPGDKCYKFRNTSMSFTSCNDIHKRISCDNPHHVKMINSNYKNILSRPNYKDNHHMITVLSPGHLVNKNTDKDFHFLRLIKINQINPKTMYSIYKNAPDKTKKQFIKYLNNDGKYIWFHQRGWSSGGPIMHDAKNNLIINPRQNDFNYGRLNYSIPCGIFKVNTRKASVFSNFNRPSHLLRHTKTNWE
jgi:hypothetical protein